MSKFEIKMPFKNTREEVLLGGIHIKNKIGAVSIHGHIDISNDEYGHHKIRTLISSLSSIEKTIEKSIKNKKIT